MTDTAGGGVGARGGTGVPGVSDEGPTAPLRAAASIRGTGVLPPADRAIDRAGVRDGHRATGPA